MSKPGSIVYYHWHGDGDGYYLDAPDFDPKKLDYVERCELEAKLMALAAIVDPGTWDEYQRNQSITRTIIRNEGDVT